jgi:predicted transcriptional regulator
VTINELADKLSLKRLSGNGDREIASCYISDLLSRVLGGCSADDVWITVQSSLNMVAVATMVDAACVILPESLTAADSVLEQANAEGLSIFTSEHDAYTLACKISKLL